MCRIAVTTQTKNVDKSYWNHMDIISNSQIPDFAMRFWNGPFNASYFVIHDSNMIAKGLWFQYDFFSLYLNSIWVTCYFFTYPLQVLISISALLLIIAVIKDPKWDWEAQSAQKVKGIYEVLSMKRELNGKIKYLNSAYRYIHDGPFIIFRPEKEQRCFMPSVHSRLGDFGNL
jgi:hypothetical protein